MEKQWGYLELVTTASGIWEQKDKLSNTNKQNQIKRFGNMVQREKLYSDFYISDFTALLKKSLKNGAKYFMWEERNSMWLLGSRLAKVFAKRKKNPVRSHDWNTDSW